MYVINNFVYGHEMAVNEKLNNALHEFDVEFRKHINKKDFMVDFPYHGGQCAGDVSSVIFGTVITDDDGNRDFSKEIRNAKAEDYKEDYKIFLKSYIDYILENKGLDEEGFDEFANYDEFADKLVNFLQSTEPDFYTVQSSS